MNHNVAKSIVNGKQVWRAYYDGVIVCTVFTYAEAVNFLNSLIYGTESAI
jgi:hypothetical protein